MLSVIPLGIAVGEPEADAEALEPDVAVLFFSRSLAAEPASVALGLADGDGDADAHALAVAAPETSWPSSVRPSRSSDQRRSGAGWARRTRAPSSCRGPRTNPRY